MQRTRKADALSVPSVPRDRALVDAVKTSSGWVAYALTGAGLRATRIAHRSRSEALRRLKEEIRLKGFVTRSAPRAIAAPWGKLLKGALEGRDIDLSGVPVDDRGWSGFAQRVYRRVRKIPRGKVMSYGEVARAVSSPGAARAVGQLMARNPVAPVVPCHRVVGSDGSLRGFSARGGVQLKAEMLAREKRAD